MFLFVINSEYQKINPLNLYLDTNEALSRSLNQKVVGNALTGSSLSSRFRKK